MFLFSSWKTQNLNHMNGFVGIENIVSLFKKSNIIQFINFFAGEKTRKRK